MEEQEKKDKPTTEPPKLPEIEAPKLDIRPEIKDTIDYLADQLIPSMTTHEIQYLVQKTGLIPASQVKRLLSRQPKPKAVTPLTANPRRKRAVEVLPEIREWNQIMDYIEDHVTEGFEEPSAIVPLGNQQNPVLEMIMQRVGNFLDNLSKNPKVAESFANFLDALAKKMEAK